MIPIIIELIIKVLEACLIVGIAVLLLVLGGWLIGWLPISQYLKDRAKAKIKRATDRVIGHGADKVADLTKEAIKKVGQKK